MGFEENIKKWVVLDTQIKQLNDKSKELKDEKNSIETNILDYVQTLSECIKNPSQVEQIMNYIKDKREIKYSKDIKRYYEKE